MAQCWDQPSPVAGSWLGCWFRISIVVELIKQCEDATPGINSENYKPCHHCAKGKQCWRAWVARRYKANNQVANRDNNSATEKDSALLRENSYCGATMCRVECCLLEPFLVCGVHKCVM